MIAPVVLCAPAGTGKTTVARALLDRYDDLEFSVSATTRGARPTEEPGVDYHFVDRETFERMAERGELLEWATVHGELYGTPRSNLEDAERRGKRLVLDIDVQGARQVSEAISETITVFLLPPSAEVLIERLRRRGSEAGAALSRRLATARRELQAVGEFKHVVVNDELDEAIADVRAIIDGGAPRRQLGRGEVERLRARMLDQLESTIG